MTTPDQRAALAQELERLTQRSPENDARPFGGAIAIAMLVSDNRDTILTALRSTAAAQTSDARDAAEAAEVAREKARLYDLIVARGMFVQPGDREWHVAADDGPWCDGNTLSEAINAAIAASGGAE